MTNTQAKCLACGHADEIADSPALEDSIRNCTECNARMTYGALAPRIVVEPFDDAKGRRWIRIRRQNPVTRADVEVLDLDPQHASLLATDLRGLVTA